MVVSIFNFLRYMSISTGLRKGGDGATKRGETDIDKEIET